MTNLIDIFFSPGKVFESLREKPVFLSPMIATMLLAMLIFYVIAHFVGMENITRKQMESGNRMVASLSEQQKEDAIRRAGSTQQLAISFAAAAIGSAIVLLVTAGCVLGVLAIAGGKVKFSGMLGVTAYAAVPFTLLALVMTLAIVLASPDRDALDVNNLIATNIGAFLNKETTNKAVYSIAGSMDLLSFAHIAFLGWGASKLSRLSFVTCTVLVTALWAVLVLAKAGVAMLF